MVTALDATRTLLSTNRAESSRDWFPLQSGGKQDGAHRGAHGEVDHLDDNECPLGRRQQRQHAVAVLHHRLAASTLSGTIPLENIVTKARCGPDSGMSPIREAMTSTPQ